MDPAEVQLARAFQRSGEMFLRFYHTTVKGEATEERYLEEQVELCRSLLELVEVTRSRAADLHTQENEASDDGHPHSSLRQEVEVLATSIELTVRKMVVLRESIPSFQESDSLRPIAVVRDRLKESGQKMLVVASTFHEVDQVAKAIPPSPPLLLRTEDRLVKLLGELEALLRLSREHLAVTITELTLLKKAGAAGSAKD